eukprot:Clim_evm126s109 gene=Clim_evmTU126s109
MPIALSRPQNGSQPVDVHPTPPPKEYLNSTMQSGISAITPEVAKGVPRLPQGMSANERLSSARRRLTSGMSSRRSLLSYGTPGLATLRSGPQYTGLTAALDAEAASEVLSSFAGTADSEISEEINTQSMKEMKAMYHDLLVRFDHVSRLLDVVSVESAQNAVTMRQLETMPSKVESLESAIKTIQTLHRECDIREIARDVHRNTQQVQYHDQELTSIKKSSTMTLVWTPGCGQVFPFESQI